MRKIVTTDIHGCYNVFIKGLETLHYNPDEDKLILLGDYIDRGKDSAQVVKYVRDLPQKNLVTLLGNHEEFAIDAFQVHDFQLWNQNGGNKTRESYYRGNCYTIQGDANWFKKLPLYHIDGEFLFVHAGLDVRKPLEKQTRDELLWAREDWYMNADKYNDYIVVFGHTPTQFIMNDRNHDTVVKCGKHYAIDTGCIFGGCMTFMIIDDDGFIRFEKFK